MPVLSRKSSIQVLDARSGLASLDKPSTLKVLLQAGMLTWTLCIRIRNLEKQMLLFGVKHTVSGLDKPWRYLLLTLDGYIFRLTLFHSTMFSQDYRINSQDWLIHMQLNLKDQCPTGCMNTLKVSHGCCLRASQDGSGGMMVQMSIFQTNRRQVGITFQKEVSTMSKELHKVNTFQNMFIITICTQMSMKTQGKQEERRQQITDNSCQLASFHLKTGNEALVSAQ